MDYAGIALLIGKLEYLKIFLTITLLLSNNSILIFTLISVGSTIPWLYYGFYCQFYAKLTYIIAVSVCGISVMILMLLEKFNQPEYRYLLLLHNTYMCRNIPKRNHIGKLSFILQQNIFFLLSESSELQFLLPSD